MESEKIELMNKLLENSTLTDEETVEIGRKINRNIAKRHGLKLN